MKKQKHIHFIGVCGVGMGAIAVMMKKIGWRVTGSDKGFFPPMSTFLEKNKIDFYPGWHPEKMGKPDIVVVGNFVSLKNPEYLFAQKNSFKINSYPEILAEYLIKKNSLVVTGTFGKTSITSFLTHAFKKANKKPSWFIGGLAKNISCGAKINSGSWSIVEGDEYTTARWDNRPKFLLYHPTHLVLTAVFWDHIDVYPTEEKYRQAFKKLVKSIPDSGTIVAAQRKNNKNMEEILKQAKAKIVRYGKKEDVKSKNGYGYQINKIGKIFSEFSVFYQNKLLGRFKTPLIGSHQIENLCGGIAMAHQNKISLKALQAASETFTGVKRRLDLRAEKNNIKVIDDLAHSPSKAQGTLNALRDYYPKSNIFAVFEPNVGNRTISSKKLYQNAFNQADFVVIPRLSKTKIKPGQEKRMNGKELAQTIQQKNKETKVLYLDKDEEIIKFLTTQTKPKDIIIFLGSHGFRKMIEQTIISLRQ